MLYFYVNWRYCDSNFNFIC